MTRPLSRRFACVLLALLLTAPGWRQSRMAGQAASATKLSTVLADLALVVLADRGTVRPDLQSLSRMPLREDWPASVGDASDMARLRMTDAGEVQVYVLVDEVTDEAVARLAGAGAVVELVDVAARRVQARVPASRLVAIASLPGVTFVRPPSYAMRHAGAFESEGDRILGADLAREDLGVDGSGVRVGVISDGIKGIFATKCRTCAGASDGPIASRDLPDSVGVRDTRGVLLESSGGVTGVSFRADRDLEGLPSPRPFCAFGGAGAEGTALLEIVHDLAPRATLSFGNASTSLEFNAAVNALAAENDVVVDDLGFYGEPANGASVVSRNTAAALNNASYRIRTYVTSAGNGADDHYAGLFADSGVEGSPIVGVGSGRLHLFRPSADTTDVLGLGPQPHDIIVLPKNAQIVIILTWDDPAGRSGNDYNLYLVRDGDRRIAARSVDAQRGDQDPIEVIDFVNRGDAGRFRILIQNAGNRAEPRTLNMFAFAPQCAPAGPARLSPTRPERHNFNTPTRSLSAQSDAGGSPASVISVAAICSASASAASLFASSGVPNASCNDLTHRTVQAYSARGPTLDGRLKPDIAAIDGVAVTGAGGFPSLFFGTSAAAPHVAAIAALALQAAPCLRAGLPASAAAAEARVALRQLLLFNADPIGDVVPNTTFGYGRVNALRTVQSAAATCVPR